MPPKTVKVINYRDVIPGDRPAPNREELINILRDLLDQDEKDNDNDIKVEDQKVIEVKDEKEGKEEKHQPEKPKVTGRIMAKPGEKNNVIYDKEQQKYISLSTATKNGIIKDFKKPYPEWRYKLRKGELIVYLPRRKVYELKSTQEVLKLLSESKITPVNIHGYYFIKTTIGEQNPAQYENININAADVLDKQKNYTPVIPIQILKSTMPQHERWKYIHSMKDGDIIRYVLKNNEKTEPFGAKYALYNFLLNNDISGKGVFFVTRNGRIIFEIDLNIKEQPNGTRGGSDITQWWNQIGFYIGMQSSDLRIWEQTDDRYFLGTNAGSDKELRDTDTTFYFSYDRTLDIQKIYQTFRDNENNACFFDGIEEFCNNKINENVKYKSKYKTVLNKIKVWREKLPDGVPEDRIQEIVDNLGINVKINDILGKEFLTYKTNSKSQMRTTVTYINTRCNHLELNEYNNTSNIKNLETNEEMIEIYNDNVESDKWFYYLGSKKEPKSIICDSGTYNFKSEDSKIISKFNEDNRLNDFAIDIKVEKEKYKFLSKGVNYASHCAFNLLKKLNKMVVQNDSNYKDYDMIKAYTQFLKCAQYVGFPNHLTPVLKLKDWTVEKCRQYVGYYRVLVENIKDKNAKKILEEMGFKETGEYNLTSPEILFFSEHAKVDFTFFEGCYSITPLHLKFTDEMKESKKRYGHWAGKLNRVEEKRTYKSICSLDTARVLRGKYDEITINKYFKESDDTEVTVSDKVEIKVEFDKDKVMWLGHIGGFITAYTRCQVLNELFKIDHSRIIGYKLDGFIVKGKVEHLDELAKKGDLWQDKTKDKKVDFEWGFKIFDSSQFNLNRIVQTSYSMKIEKDIFKNRLLLFSGAGGCGKTHTILNEMRDTLYVTLQWALCVKKMVEYPGIKAISLHQLLGINCEPYTKRHKIPARILVDEITQIDKKYILEIINHSDLKHTQIIFCGDVSKKGYFQCSFKDVEVIDKKVINKYLECFEFTDNYRCKDEELLKILNDLREKMISSKFNTVEITKYVLKKLKNRIIKEEELIKTYDYKKDWVLCSTTNDVLDYDEDENIIESQTKYYTNLFKDKGQKLLCVRHTKDEIFKKMQQVENIHLKGEVVYDIKESSKYQLRHAFTIHSFQGVTIKSPDRLFIDTKRIFCPRQLYTALSRVEYLNQIYLLI